MLHGAAVVVEEIEQVVAVETGEAAVEAGADEVTGDGEVGCGVAINGKQAVFLLRSALDALQGAVEGGGGFAEFQGGLPGFVCLIGGTSAAAAGLADELGGACDERVIDVSHGECRFVGDGGIADGLRDGDVVKLGLVELATGLRGLVYNRSERCGGAFVHGFEVDY